MDKSTISMVSYAVETAQPSIDFFLFTSLKRGANEKLTVIAIEITV